jgi:cold shock CspA family protein
MSIETDNQNLLKRLSGMVKWFNNKSGFGFITVCSEGEFNKKDIFVHYSSIRVSNPQYKYLVQGEYVDFTLIQPADSKHEYQATDITGIMGGSIMCETQRLAQIVSRSDGEVSLHKKPRNRRVPNKNTIPENM